MPGDKSRGKGPGENHVLLHCPFCGLDTPNDYMHVSLSGAGWYCFRRNEHAGISPAKLVAGLLGISIGEALSITGQHKHLPSNFLEAVMSHMGTNVVPRPNHVLRMPIEFKPINKSLAITLVMFYMRRRGFSDKDILNATDLYDIRFCRKGPYSNRVIFPVKFKGALKTWTGRTISKNVDLRYKTLSDKPDKAKLEGYPPALGPISDYLLWYDELWDMDASTIIITEGPFDAFKLMTIGRKSGIAATCLFTNRPSEAQTDLLYRLLPRFRHRFLMLDQGTLASMMRMSSRLITLKIRPLILPDSIKDPGEMEPRDLTDILTKSIRGGDLLFSKS